MEVSIYETLTGNTARALLGLENNFPLESQNSKANPHEWTQSILQRIDEWHKPEDLFQIGRCAFDAFLQCNVTGPPLTWTSATVIFPPNFIDRNENGLEGIRKHLIASFTVDGEAVYQLIPNIELLWLVKHIWNSPSLGNDPEKVLARLRVNFWHQYLLSDVSPSLQQVIYDDLNTLAESLLTRDTTASLIDPAQFLIERAVIHLHHGFDARARGDLRRAAKLRSFDFTLTGRLGKRTKFQENPTSQLIVLAKSADSTASGRERNRSEESYATTERAPQALSLNDDTLLESISFTEASGEVAASQAEEVLPDSLKSLDPGSQPLLEPLDAIILLNTASSITNALPADGLTREETLPFVERVITGGSSNWQVYTQALLLRSRIEGYKTRTVERGVLQLQALVDQVIAETTSEHQIHDSVNPQTSTSSTFLPQPKCAESASVSERLAFVHQLMFTPRWKLEAELAHRWVSLGGLRTALEIYERLQMWAEVALCFAANDREDKARKILRQRLYQSTTGSIETINLDEEGVGVETSNVERDPLPADAPRLFCILGDIDKSEAPYERAWEISNHRYARAQRSLGKHYLAAGKMSKADEAYSMSLKVNPQNHSTWFALGCIRLKTEDWAGAVQAFGRAVEIEDTDAESWSNLAVALLRQPPEISSERRAKLGDDDTEFDKNGEAAQFDFQKHTRQSYSALKRAAALKRDSFRIWQNLLSVSLKLSPPPYTDIVIAQGRLIDLLGKSESEKCVDADIVEALVAHLITVSPSTSGSAKDFENSDDADGDQPRKKKGLERMIIDLVQKKIAPLITSSRRLWLITAKLSLHLGHPAAALASYEKAWRVTLNQPEWESGGSTATIKDAWREVAESTIDLADAYESLGERHRESGMAAGEMVAKDWKFKARSAVRSVLARSKEGWQDDPKYEVLNERLQDLKNV